MSVAQPGGSTPNIGHRLPGNEETPEIMPSSRASGGRSGLLLLGISFVGSEQEVREFLYGPNFLTHVQCSVKVFLGGDAHRVAHVYIPTPPLRAEEAARLSARECRHFSRSFMASIKDPEAAAQWQGGLFEHHFSNFNDSIGFVLPIVVGLGDVPARPLEAHPFNALETLRGGLQVQLLDEEFEVFDDSEDDESLRNFTPFPSFEVLSVNHFLIACRDGLALALTRHRDRFVERIVQMREQGETIEATLCGVDFALDLGGGQKFVLATNWIRDDVTRQQLALMIRDAVSPNVAGENLMSDAHYWMRAAEYAINQEMRRSFSEQLGLKMH